MQRLEDEFPSLAREMSKWVDEVTGTGYHGFRRSDAWSPHVNLYEDESRYCMVVELPGISPAEDLLRVENGMLILSGVRPTPGLAEMAEAVRIHRMEIDQGRFYRGIKLPENVDIDAIEATYRSGFLWIRMPKTS